MHDPLGFEINVVMIIYLISHDELVFFFAQPHRVDETILNVTFKFRVILNNVDQNTPNFLSVLRVNRLQVTAILLAIFLSLIHI